MRHTLRILTLFLLLSCVLGACKKNMFDADTAKKIMDISFHNDTVDKYHDWTLIADWLVQISVSATFQAQISGSIQSAH